jgi:hypothetical protein
LQGLCTCESTKSIKGPNSLDDCLQALTSNSFRRRRVTFRLLLGRRADINQSIISQKCTLNDKINFYSFQLLNMTFNRINFHGHLRLSGVCKRWHNLVQNDLLFMRTVLFKSSSIMDETHLMRSYKCVELHRYEPEDNFIAENWRKLFKNAEIMYISCISQDVLNCIMPLCENLREIVTYSLHPTFDTTATQLTFKHPLPVSVTPETEISPEFLDRFNVIANIPNLSFNPGSSYKLLAKYGAVINSLKISLFRNDSIFHRLCQFENLHLQSLYFWYFPKIELEKDSDVQSFFAKQAPSLEAIEIQGNVDALMIDSMCLLSNLETIKITCCTSQHLRWNDLNALSKLRCLDFELLDDYDEYILDVSVLTTLAELRISSRSDDTTWLRIKLDKPMQTLEKLTVSRLVIDLECLEQIVQVMPGLKVLDIGDWVRQK